MCKQIDDLRSSQTQQTEELGGKIPALKALIEKHFSYISRALGPRHHNLSIYGKELLAVVDAMQTWNAYLAHAKFIIRTDQKSLKFLLEQKITTPFQHMWLSKLMGYTFEVLVQAGQRKHHS